MDRNTRWITQRSIAVVALVMIAGSGGCATMGPPDGRPLIPTAFQIKTGPYLVCTNNKLDPNASVVKQLRMLETQIDGTLGMRVDPAANPVRVYILDDRKSFEHFLTFYYPELPHRRAFFLANGNERLVYTFFGDRLEEDIRHEATHALLHVAIGDIPLWLDEGLAEYFESPSERGGINAEHLGRLPDDLNAGWSPNLAHLESLRAVTQMTPRDYRESWAWVHYLLNSGKSEKAAILGYLADLRSSPEARLISTRLEDPESGPLLAHLDQIRKNPIAVEPLQDPTIRLQSGFAEAPVVAPRKKSVFGRIRDLFGP